MGERISWGILGAGWIASRFAADLAFGTTGRVGRIAARDPGRARTLAAQYGGEGADSYEALVQDPAIDAVYIATPASLHRDHCLMALAAGKPVLCEKPFALSAGQAREIADAAAQAGVFCMEAMWTRFLPVMTEIRARVQRGDLGAVTQLDAALGFPRAEGAENAAITSPELGGGALFDLGIYGVSMAHDLLGAPDKVAAQGLISGAGSLRDVAVTLHHASALSTIRASHSTALGNRLEIAGARARIEVDAPFIQAAGAVQLPVAESPRGPARPSKVKDSLRNSPLWPVARGVARAVTGRSGDKIAGRFPGYGLWFEADEVARCLAQGRTESAIMPLSGSVAVLETMDRIGACLTGQTRD